MKTFSIALCICIIVLASASAVAATIDVPQTGQTVCYDVTGTGIACAGTGQDGELLIGMRWPSPRFTDNGDGTVTDNLTGLMWLKDANCLSNQYPGVDIDGSTFWQVVLDFVNGINDGTYPNCQAGYADWRTPNINELKSLIDFDQDTPALPAAHPFTSVENEYWSSTTHSSNRSHAFCVFLNDGTIDPAGKSLTPRAVWPVRDSGVQGSIELPKTRQATCYDSTGLTVTCANTGQDAEYAAGVAWPVPRFTDNGDGTVTDELTGLIWFADVADCMGGAGDWQNALDAVVDLNANPATYHAIGACGYTETHNDWRLANIRELESIVHYDASEEGAGSSSADWLNSLGVGFNAISSYHWSSNSDVDSAGNAYAHGIASFVASGAFDKDGASLFYIWPVRGGLYGDPDIRVAPTAVDFGSTTIGTSATQDITVTNDGTYYLEVDATSAPTAPFSVVDDGCANQPVAPNSTCTVTLGYDPTSEGADSASVNVTSDDPDEATVAVSLSGTSTAVPNNPPATFDLVSPVDGSTGLIMPVTMTWKKTTDPDGDQITYDITYCEDDTFATCTPMTNVAATIPRSLSSKMLAFARSWATALVTGPFTLAGCGGSSAAVSDEFSYTATDLEAGKTYYWKVIANDPNGGATESAVWSFTTQQINTINQ